MSLPQTGFIVSGADFLLSPEVDEITGLFRVRFEVRFVDPSTGQGHSFYGLISGDYLTKVYAEMVALQLKGFKEAKGPESL